MKRAVRKITTEAVRQPAVIAAMAYLEGQLQYFDLDQGMAESVAIEDRSTIDLYNKVKASQHGRVQVEEWIRNMIASGRNERTLDQIAAHIHEVRDEMPPSLHDWIAARLRVTQKRQPKKRGPNPRKRHMRDVAIWKAVHLVVDDYGLEAKRNRASLHPCACSIVAKALERLGHPMLSEAAIEKIYEHYEARRRA